MAAKTATKTPAQKAEKKIYDSMISSVLLHRCLTIPEIEQAFFTDNDPVELKDALRNAGFQDVQEFAQQYPNDFKVIQMYNGMSVVPGPRPPQLIVDNMQLIRQTQAHKKPNPYSQEKGVYSPIVQARLRKTRSRSEAVSGADLRSGSADYGYNSRRPAEPSCHCSKPFGGNYNTSFNPNPNRYNLDTFQTSSLRVSTKPASRVYCTQLSAPSGYGYNCQDRPGVMYEERDQTRVPGVVGFSKLHGQFRSGADYGPPTYPRRTSPDQSSNISGGDGLRGSLFSGRQPEFFQQRVPVGISKQECAARLAGCSLEDQLAVPVAPRKPLAKLPLPDGDDDAYDFFESEDDDGDSFGTPVSRLRHKSEETVVTAVNTSFRSEQREVLSNGNDSSSYRLSDSTIRSNRTFRSNTSTICTEAVVEIPIQKEFTVVSEPSGTTKSAVGGGSSLAKQNNAKCSDDRSANSVTLPRYWERFKFYRQRREAEALKKVTNSS